MTESSADIPQELRALGWDEEWQAVFLEAGHEGTQPARLAVPRKKSYTVMTATGEHEAVIPGKTWHTQGAAGQPVVGDWVALEVVSDTASPVIRAILPRRTILTRKMPGEKVAEQYVAANVDVLFIVCGLDMDYNVRRIERYLALAHEGGVQPVVLLNKEDLVDDAARFRDEVIESAGEAAVLSMSAKDGTNMEALEVFLGPGITAAFIGSSGAGKSTLINALLGEERQDTQEVIEGTDRGKHTTTRRELIPLGDRGILVDTPGLREIQLWGDESALDDIFADIAALTEQCRFRDCSHTSEPGCAVIEAVETGDLSPKRVASYHKLSRELRHLATRRDEQARLEEKQKNKRFHKMIKRSPKTRPW